ncbi:hypothetical protein NOF04DRAFT_1278297 [Fusarium oxysporum II5]|nr:hypothetical protein NOF04DRAFT_1278297 [Fusarium oxysporum II5]
MWGRAKASQGISKFCFALLSAAEDSKVLGDLLASHRQVLQHTKPSLVCRTQGLGSNGPDPNIWFTMIGISEEGQGPLVMMSTFRKKLKVLTGPLNKRYGRGVEMVIDSALGARLPVINCP